MKAGAPIAVVLALLIVCACARSGVAPSVLPPSAGDPAGVSCWAAGACAVVADAPARGGTLPRIVTRRSPRSAWTGTSVPPGIADLYGIDCPSSELCVAIGGTAGSQGTRSAAAVFSYNRGTAWTRAAMPDVATDLQAVSCTAGSFCVAVGSGASPFPIVVSTDGGVTWRTASPPPGFTGGLSSVACPIEGICVAVGTGAYYSRDGGASWEGGRLPANTPDFDGVACTTATSCVAVSSGESSPWGGAGTGSASYTTDGGRTWSPARVPPKLFGLDAVSCPSRNRCVAVGVGTVVVSSDGGRTWTRGSLSNPAAVLSSVSCVSVRYCVAVGTTSPASSAGQVFVTFDGGESWS